MAGTLLAGPSDGRIDDVREATIGLRDGIGVDLAVTVYQHVRRERPREVLELGSAHGVSTAYIAAALEANGVGRLTTVDHASASFVPRPEELLDRLGLSHRVDVVRAHSSYTWYLKELIEERSDRHGNCAPLFDVCLLDGAHDWTVDGLAVVLVEKLLNPGGWLVLDDLDWAGGGATPAGFFKSPSEERADHMRDVFDLIVRQHPAFTEFRVQDGRWAWARKAAAEDEQRRLTLVVTRPASAIMALAVLRAYHALDRRVRTSLVRHGAPAAVLVASLAVC